MERAQLLLNVTIAQNDYSTTTEKKGVHVSVLISAVIGANSIFSLANSPLPPSLRPSLCVVHDDALAVTSPTLAYARSVSAPPMTVEISIRWAALEQH